MSVVGLCRMCPPSTRPALLTAGLCKWHHQHPEEVATRSKTEIVTALRIESDIKPATEKRAKENRAYTKLRKAFLEANPFCLAKLEGCGVRANQIHHKLGRIGSLLTNVAFFLPVCDSCHSFIESNPEEAIERGFSLRRNSPHP